jgi:hypothetical protein
MDKFDLKKYLAEGKLHKPTLNEGQFSWMTQDSGEQIGSKPENTIDVYMIDNKGNVYYEDKYEGYGKFGGKDYYELLDQMNGGKGDRSRGIGLAFEKIDTESPVLFPALVTDPKFVGPNYDFTEEAESDLNQSWYQEEEDVDAWDSKDEWYDGEDEDEDY